MERNQVRRGFGMLAQLVGALFLVREYPPNNWPPHVLGLVTALFLMIVGATATLLALIEQKADQVKQPLEERLASLEAEIAALHEREVG